MHLAGTHGEHELGRLKEGEEEEGKGWGEREEREGGGKGTEGKKRR